MNRSAASLLCAAVFAHASEAAQVTVNVATRNGTAVGDAVVIFDPLDADPPPGRGSATIDQIHKQFVPRVSVVRTGTSITFPNSDQIRHQVYSFSQPKVFSLKLYAGTAAVPVVFDKPGLVVLGCNIHDNMVAFVGVVDTPYFAKTPDSGTATVNLPAGHYRLRLWHPDLAAAIAPLPIIVEAAAQTLSLVVDLATAPSAPADWP
jgi:plastocyanin